MRFGKVCWASHQIGSCGFQEDLCAISRRWIPPYAWCEYAPRCCWIQFPAFIEGFSSFIFTLCYFRITDSDGFVNAICHFPWSPPLQPKRIIIKTWNLAWTLILGQIVGPPRRFLISCPKAAIWGRGGGTPGGKICQKIFFRFFKFFRLGYLV